MWRGTQFRVAAAMRVRRAATIFSVVGLLVVVGAANPATLPDGYVAALSSQSVVLTPAVATRVAPTRSCNPTPVASNTQAQGDSSIRTTVAAGRTGSTFASYKSRIVPDTIPLWMPLSGIRSPKQGCTKKRNNDESRRLCREACS
jgi:hypothetical protein